MPDNSKTTAVDGDVLETAQRAPEHGIERVRAEQRLNLSGIATMAFEEAHRLIEKVHRSAMETSLYYRDMDESRVLSREATCQAVCEARACIQIGSHYLDVLLGEFDDPPF